jgi:segregation and condensation protein B
MPDDYAALLDGSKATDTPPPLLRIIEAMLFAGGQPITPELACGAINDLTPEQFRATVDELAKLYKRQDRPYQVRRGPKGYVLALQSQFRFLKERLAGGPKTTKLSQAALDVLSIVAYKQPVNRQEINSLCQQDCAASLRQLVRLGLVAVTADGVYSTTPRFLDLFKLKSLDDMPRTTDLKKI